MEKKFITYLEALEQYSRDISSMDFENAKAVEKTTQGVIGVVTAVLNQDSDVNAVKSLLGNIQSGYRKRQDEYTSNATRRTTENPELLLAIAAALTKGMMQLKQKAQSF